MKFEKRSLCNNNLPRKRCKTTISRQVITTGKKGDTPTTARLNIAPNNITMILSIGVLRPNDLLPDILISNSAMMKTSIPRQLICRTVRSLPVPKNSVNVSIIKSYTSTKYDCRINESIIIHPRFLSLFCFIIRTAVLALIIPVGLNDFPAISL